MRHTDMFDSQGLTDLGLPRSNDIMFEPEEELSVTQEKLHKERSAFSNISLKPTVCPLVTPESRVALLHENDALHKSHAAALKAMDMGAINFKLENPVDLKEGAIDAKQAGIKPKKEKKRKEKVRFEHLQCCIENVKLQEDLAAAEKHIALQDQKLKEMKSKSAEMLGHLNAEIQSLKARMSNQSAPESEQIFALRVQLEMATTRTRVETDDMQKQIESQKIRITQLEESLMQVETEALDSKTKLAEIWKSHGQEVSKLQHELAQERATHQQEVQKLNSRLEEVRAVTKDTPVRASDEMLANAHQDILKLEEKVLQVCCENLKAEQELKKHKDLMEQCIKLHSPASSLVILFGQPLLPPLHAHSKTDPCFHVQWLHLLGENMSNIHQQLATRVSSQ